MEWLFKPPVLALSHPIKDRLMSLHLPHKSLINKLAFTRIGVAALLSQLVFTAHVAMAETNVAAKVALPIQSYILQPAELPPPAISELKVPQGFSVSKVAENLGNARVLAISPQGNLYVTRREQGDVLMLPKTGDTFGKPVRVASAVCLANAF